MSFRVLGLSGSLRRRSSNRAALQAAVELAPSDLDLRIYEGLASLPWFNPDLESAALPPVVVELRAAVDAADALLLACPEYAHGVPGAFKNLLDWLVGSPDFPGKPVMLLNVSGRSPHHAQDALAEILRTMSARLLTDEPPVVALPGSGCEAASVLADAERCDEVRSALAVMVRRLSA